MKYVIMSYIDGIRQYYTHYENKIPEFSADISEAMNFNNVAEAKQVKNMILLYFLINVKKNVNVDIVNVTLNDYAL